MLKRVVLQHTPKIFALVGIHDDAEPWLAGTQVEISGKTYFRAETHDHYILLKAAVEGWGGTTYPPDARQQ